MSYYAELGILGVVSGVGTVEEVSDADHRIHLTVRRRPNRAHRP